MDIVDSLAFVCVCVYVVAVLYQFDSRIHFNNEKLF